MVLGGKRCLKNAADIEKKYPVSATATKEKHVPAIKKEVFGQKYFAGRDIIY